MTRAPASSFAIAAGDSSARDTTAEQKASANSAKESAGDDEAGTVSAAAGTAESRAVRTKQRRIGRGRYMKKVLMLIVVVVGGIYVVGWVNLSMAGSARFLGTMDQLLVEGKGEEMCARLHDDLHVSIQDHTSPVAAGIEGGKEEYCDYLDTASKGMRMLRVSTQAERHDYTVERTWLHPWTAQVRYYEERTTTMALTNLTIRSESDDKITLVYTFGGVKLLRIESSVQLATD